MTENRLIHRLITSVCCWLLMPVFQLSAADSLTIFMHHNVSDTTPRSTSVSPEVFEQNLQNLLQERFTVVKLDEAVATLRQGGKLADKAVAITFDDADRSIYEHAFPLLQKYQLPFTVFVNTGPVDKQYGRAMSWEMLRELHDYGATIANHTTDHDYLVRTELHDDAWLERVVADIDHAQQRLIDELGSAPKLFAYPYGEYNNRLRQTLAEQGWTAFGQHAGAVNRHSDFSALPRFPADGVYSNWKTLRVKLNARPLPIDYQALPDPLVSSNTGDNTSDSASLDQTPLLPVTFNKSDSQLNNVRKDALRCYIQGEAITPEWQGDQSGFVVSAPSPLSKGRTRYNCTAPAKSGGYYYWLSHQWIRS